MPFLTEAFTRGIYKMKIKYFSDTDTALIEFQECAVHETRELSEEVYVDLDMKGNLVSLTLEHARERARLPEIHFEEIPATRE